MYKSKKILCVIPARGGSKGLPGKNIKLLLGKPLIAYSIEQARSSRYIDKVIVSTEDEKIAKIARLFNVCVPFMRPKSLSQDSSNIRDVLLHTINWMERKEKENFDILVLLQANSPLRNTADIERCIEILVGDNASNVFSVSDAYRNPYFNMVELSDTGLVRLIKKGDYSNRQEAPQVYDMNGSIYVWWIDIFKKKKRDFLPKTRIYIMPKERSVDIDYPLDFEIAEMILKKANRDGENH